MPSGGIWAAIDPFFFEYIEGATSSMIFSENRFPLFRIML
jgi:hypothetical protein